MTAATPSKTRRRQVDRTAETRSALIEAAIRVIYRDGYGGASTAVIAEEAGVSRGAILHHFGTRAQLMADVITEVYAQEHRDYQLLEAQGYDGMRVWDWPEMLWQVLRKPSGVAVLEILQAARSDQELATLVAPAQSRIEEIATAGMLERFPNVDKAESLSAMRLFVWAVRGLSIAQVLAPEPRSIRSSVLFFRRIVEAAVESGLVLTVKTSSSPAPKA